jgi:hypothetical protein
LSVSLFTLATGDQADTLPTTVETVRLLDDGRYHVCAAVARQVGALVVVEYVGGGATILGAEEHMRRLRIAAGLGR